MAHTLTTDEVIALARKAKAYLQRFWTPCNPRAYVSKDNRICITVEWHKLRTEELQDEVGDYLSELARKNGMKWGYELEACGWSSELVEMKEV